MLRLARGGASEMPLNEATREAERERIARHVLDLVKERGSEIAWTVAMAESGLTRTRFEALFADYDDLFDAVAQTWLAPHMAVMEEVLATTLPPQRKMYEFFRRRFVISQ
jgi:TetR/AcrR family transcriptional repressor of the ameABC operon